MLKTAAEAAVGGCVVQLVEAEWREPVDRHNWVSDRAILTMIVDSSSYRAEGYFAGPQRVDYERIGPVFFVPPDRELIGRSAGGAFAAVRCVFDPATHGELLGALGAMTNAQLARSLHIGSASIVMLMQRLLHETVSPGLASASLIESIASMLLIDCVRELCGADAVATTTGGLQHRHLRVIEEYLDRVEGAAPTITGLARLCGLNGDYLARLYREETGQSLGRSLAAARIRKAERLLLETNLPLKDIAFRLGFANAANFSTAFRKARNETPARFRERKRGDRPALTGERLH